MQRPLREGAVTQQASCETAPIVPPPAQLSLFGFAVRADDLTTTSEPCPHCGATMITPRPRLWIRSWRRRVSATRLNWPACVALGWCCAARLIRGVSGPSRIKALTGGDRISARFMKQDFFQYTPQFKLLVIGNHKPGIRSVDEAIRRRLHLLPFTITIGKAKQDKKLTEKLLLERDGILAWAVEGCLEWQLKGLTPPPCVVAATEEYFQEEDRIGQFLEEECDLNDHAKVAIADLYTRWRERAEAHGEYVGSSKWLVGELRDRGFERARLRAAARVCLVCA
jgi:hypothetical protein